MRGRGLAQGAVEFVWGHGKGLGSCPAAPTVLPAEPEDTEHAVVEQISLPELLQLNSLRSGSQQSLTTYNFVCDKPAQRPPCGAGRGLAAPSGIWEPPCQQKQVQQGWMWPREGQVVFAAPPSPGHEAAVPNPLQIPAAAARGASQEPGLADPSGASPLAAP